MRGCRKSLLSNKEIIKTIFSFFLDLFSDLTHKLMGSHLISKQRSLGLLRL